MFNRWFILLFLMAIMVCLASCGQKIKDSVAPINTSVQYPDSSAKQIVILPLADYTMGARPDDSLRRQIKIYEALMYRLAEKGFYIPVEEDVVQYLVDLGVIRIIGQPSIHSSNSYRLITEELSSGWSDAMQEEIQKLVVKNEQLGKSKQGYEIARVGLDPGTIQQIGRRFGADYILRGRIVEYEVRDDNTLNPLEVGILPFLFDTSSALLFGFAESEQYDLWQDLTFGAGMGALFGSHAETPYTAPDKKTTVSGSHPRFATESVSTHGGHEDHAALNAAVWGAAGASAAYLASKGGQVKQAVVQISLALQDASDGRIVWANRVEKQVKPISMWADPAVRIQIDRAVEEAATALIVNLANALSNSPVDDYAAISDVQSIPITKESKESEIQKVNDPIIKDQQVQEDPAT
jgi:curli biogenesis system outer membrane secretion channel CsgG